VGKRKETLQCRGYAQSMQLFLEYDSSRVKSSKCVKSEIIARRVALLLVVFVTSNDIAQADINGIPYNSNFPKAQYPVSVQGAGRFTSNSSPAEPLTAA